MRAATLTQKRQTKVDTSPSHSVLTPGQPVVELTPIPLGFCLLPVFSWLRRETETESQTDRREKGRERERERESERERERERDTD